jgi:hypothetical protein
LVAAGSLASCGADDNAPPVLDASAGDATLLPDGALLIEGPVASISPSSIDFPAALCAGPSATNLPQFVAVTNNGTTPLVVAAKMSGGVFAVSPTSLNVPPGMTANLTVKSTMPSYAAAGAVVQGYLGLFTNDPANANVTIPVTATPTGATLALVSGPSSFSFPSTPVGNPGPPQTVTLTNLGNAPGSFTINSFGFSPNFSISTASAASGVLQPGASWSIVANFTPTQAGPVTASTAIAPTTSDGTNPTYPVCGAGIQALSFSGEGTTALLAGWPTSAIDFGPTGCGAVQGPSARSFVLNNSGTLDVHLTGAQLTGAPGFGTNAIPGTLVPAQGSATVQLTAPQVRMNAPLGHVSATLTFATDAEKRTRAIRMTEQPTGPVVQFDPATTPVDFGSVPSFKPITKTFNVTNTGSGVANVTLAIVPDGNVASADGAAAPSPFAIVTPTVTLTAAGTAQATQPVAVTFTPQATTSVTGKIAMTVNGTVCGQLPDPIMVTGTGTGLGPTVVPTSVTLTATCGGPAPQAQTFLVRNDGTSNFTWSMVLGPGVQTASSTGTSDAGSALFTVSADPPAGLLMPSQVSVVTVTGTAVPSPTSQPDPAAYATQVTVLTDVPFDPPHVVTLGEIPLGDQLSITVANPLRFGQVPVGTTFGQSLTLSNGANAGSPAANVSLAVSGSGAGAYTVVPPTVASLGPGATSGNVTVTFAPTSPVASPATLTLRTTDPLCTALPAPIPVSGTGTSAHVVVSATSLAFGTDPSDPAGLVNCGATGLAQTLTITNQGNQAFTLRGLSTRLGSSSPYSLSGAAAGATVGIGQSVSVTVSPHAIPQATTNPRDASPFTDALTITTDALGDSPHLVNLIMQARGAVLSNLSIPTTWAFGAVSFGSIGSLNAALENTGNAPLTLALNGLAHPSIFTILGQPRTVPGNAADAGSSAITGEFIPPSAGGSWTDTGSLVATAASFCGAPPTGWTAAAPAGGQVQWTGPVIQLSGSSP